MPAAGRCGGLRPVHLVRRLRPRAGHLPGADVWSVPDNGQHDPEEQGGQRPLVVVGLVPDRVRQGVGAMLSSLLPSLAIGDPRTTYVWPCVSRGVAADTVSSAAGE